MSKPPTTHPARNLVRLIALAVGLVATVALLQPPGVSAAPRRFGHDQLVAISHALQHSQVRGIAWYVDDAADRVVVTVDSTVSTGEVAALDKTAGADADAVQIKHTSGVFRPLLSAGNAIYGGRYRCSLGFNVSRGSTYYFLTAGHCGKVAKSWYTNATHTTLIGPTIGYSFPGNDYALVRYDNTALSHPGGFSAANAFVGEQVKRTGSTSGTHSGRVTALNASVHYQGGGSVSGMIQTTVCAEPGLQDRRHHLLPTGPGSRQGLRRHGVLTTDLRVRSTSRL
jgi:streptogrisin B